MMRAIGLLALAFTAVAADGVWKVAPPPPDSWQRDRVADLTARRKAAMAEMGEHGMMILYAAEARNYAGDVDWPYRQENNFFYLTGLTQPGATLVLVPGGEKTREMVFLPAADASREAWTGHMLTAGEARAISGIQEIYDASQWNAFLTAVMPRTRAFLMPGGGRGGRGGVTVTGGDSGPDWRGDFARTIEDSAGGRLELYMILPPVPEAVEYRREQEFAGKVAASGAGVAIRDASGIFVKLRQVKSPREMDILRHAVDITAEAFQRTFAAAVPGTWEYELQAQFEMTFLRRDGHWGYPCIVASGVNATTLHYESNRDRMKSGDLVLMDDAAEFDQYSADVTRTIPVSGRFTKEQAEIYRVVYDAQQAGIGKVRPGHPMTGGPESVGAAAAEVLKKGLHKLGLMTDPASEEQLRVWYFHGIGHPIGLNVHDVGGRELAPGMVVTVEPGIYIRPDALEHLPKTPEMEKFAAAVRGAFEKYKGIGVRIEDDVEVTNGEPKVISSAIPSRLEDVEGEIARVRAAAKTKAMP
ncbi:MAG: aminopeptidase P family protein [Acidobacteria bacterium]|nr:aminopeptidase P family protein [Acidobacteriota bacterium]